LVKFVGNADIPGVNVKYFVFGNRRSGYSIRIIEDDVISENCFVSAKLSETLDIAYMLRRCSVFPENLPEIIEDLRFAASQETTRQP
jgi:hypothetical protein